MVQRQLDDQKQAISGAVGRGSYGNGRALLTGLLTWASLSLLSGCGIEPGGAAPVRGASADAPPAPSEGELLLAAAPAEWLETASMATPALRMAEYAPPDESANDIERVTFEAQAGKPLPDPIEFVTALTADLATGCKAFEQLNVHSGLENGYPTSVRLLMCSPSETSPHGQVVMVKAIQGNEQFYVVTRRRLLAAAAPHTAPLSAEAMAEWSLYLKGIRLCDTRSDQHPCPESLLAQ
ncbi:MAG: hypothetical protein ACNA7W_04310 [Pseudomonadales bacterium]